MPDFVNVNYAQTGGSISVNPLGMREMQERALEREGGAFSSGISVDGYRAVGRIDALQNTPL